MSTHVPSSSSVCIHSVCVSPDHRHKGIALGLLREYISRLEVAQIHGAPYQRILLITHEELRPLYEKAGFEFIGESAVVHGPRPWYEMRKVVAPVVKRIEPPLLSDFLSRVDLDTLLQQSFRSGDRPAPKLLSAFTAGGVQEVAVEGSSEEGAQSNKFDLLCPRDGCGSTILKKGVATLVESESILLEPPEKQQVTPYLPALPEPSTSTHWWRITPNPMAFENIGFSRPVGDLRKLFYLESLKLNYVFDTDC